MWKWKSEGVLNHNKEYLQALFYILGAAIKIQSLSLETQSFIDQSLKSGVERQRLNASNILRFYNIV